MKVTIFKPSRNVMQAGLGKTKLWVLEYNPATPRGPEPLMGWTASGDTLNQVRLTFASMDEAIAYAQKKGWEYAVLPEHTRRVVPRNYVDNFAYVPPEKSAKA
ncbi:ETC complex I subunit [Micavibrio aeruginosavorus]|uniref:ETC complex I subunit n=1 Tax=Micavibrio aeruginosavorus TaxID=349221 RepID=UPI003F4AAA20